MKLALKKYFKAALCMALAISLAFPFPAMAAKAEFDYDTIPDLRRVELTNGKTVDIAVGESVLLYWHDKDEKLQNATSPILPQRYYYSPTFGSYVAVPSEGARKASEREQKRKAERLGVGSIVALETHWYMFDSQMVVLDTFETELKSLGLPLLLIVVTGKKTGTVTWDLNEENPLYWALADKKEHFKFTLSVTKDGPKPESAEPDEPAPTVKEGWLNAEAINAGVKLSWSPEPDGVGYRLYRSEDPDSEGVPLTDYPVTCSEFVDANVLTDKMYYYSLRQILSQPDEDLPEELAPFVGNAQVKTRAEVLGAVFPAGEKKFILIALDDLNMNVNGINREIDAAPVLRNGYTMIPIRGIVESMGGKVGWDADTGEISIDCRDVDVRMWKDKTDITVNGAQKQIDSAPAAINGRTMVPLRFVAEGLGCAINWLDSTKQIVIVY